MTMTDENRPQIATNRSTSILEPPAPPTHVPTTLLTSAFSPIITTNSFQRYFAQQGNHLNRRFLNTSPYPTTPSFLSTMIRPSSNNPLDYSSLLSHHTSDFYQQHFLKNVGITATSTSSSVPVTVTGPSSSPTSNSSSEKASYSE